MTQEIKQTIEYAGKVCQLECEFLDNETDKAQYWINYYTKLGFKACCLHEYGRHQLYVALTKGR